MSAESQSSLLDFDDGKRDCPMGCGERIYPSRQPQHLLRCEAADREVHH
jgi:hypothetical protein